MKMWSQARDIEERTQRYWRVSLAWNLRNDDQIPTGEAIALCTENMKYCNPIRPIFHRTTSVLQEIVKGQGSTRAEPATIYILPSITAIGG